MVGKRLDDKELTDLLNRSKPDTFIQDPNDRNKVYTAEEFYTDARYSDDLPTLKWQELADIQKAFQAAGSDVIKKFVKNIFDDLTRTGLLHKDKYHAGDYCIETGHCCSGGLSISIPNGEDHYGKSTYEYITYYFTKKADAIAYAKSTDEYPVVYVAQIISEVQTNNKNRTHLHPKGGSIHTCDF